MNRPPRGSASGYTLIEVMIALAILLIGLIGFMRAQIYGITSTNGGRMHDVASELARECVTGIEQLPFNHPVLSVMGTTGSTPPAGFGRLQFASSLPTGTHTIADGDLPGVRTNAEAFGYQRRWTVWGWGPTSGGAPAVKFVAVSVMWTEPRGLGVREVVAYTQLQDAAAFSLNLAANM